jgi:hypothetical protein
MASRKSSINKKFFRFGIPSLGIFLNTINILLKETNKSSVIKHTTTRLFHVDLLLKISMQEGRFNIHLMDLPFMLSNKGKNKVDGIHFGYMGTSFIIVNSFNLGK